MTIKLVNNSVYNTQEERMAAIKKIYGTKSGRRTTIRKKREADAKIARMAQEKIYGRVLTEEETKKNIEKRLKELKIN